MSLFDRKPVLPVRQPAPPPPPASASGELPPGASLPGQLGILLAQAIFPQPRDRALDVNCGPGHVAFPLGMAIGTGGRVVGVDPSSDLLAEALKRKTTGAPGHVEFYLMEPDRLEFPSASFTLATCGLGLSTFRNPETVLKEMHRVLRTGGWIGLTVAHPGGPLLDEIPAPAAIPVAHSRPDLPAVPPPSQRGLWTEQAVAGLLVATGFTAVHVQVVRRTAVYRTVDEWWNDGAFTPDGASLPLPPGAAHGPPPAGLAHAYHERLHGRSLRVPITVTVALARRGGAMQYP